MRMRPGSRSTAPASECSADESGFLPDSNGAIPEKAGWLQKWTNYLKGYRQRWFILDSNGNLSYYRRIRKAARQVNCYHSKLRRQPSLEYRRAHSRNQAEVGVACRGSVNLQESRIHSDPATNCITISGASQSFHLKANNEVDRTNWLNALEYARHRAIKKADLDDDDTNQVSNQEDINVLVENVKSNLNSKLDQMRETEKNLSNTYVELHKSLTTKSDRDALEKLDRLKMQMDKLLHHSEGLVELTKKETQAMHRFAANEHDQRCQLQEQIETLAKQHSTLEHAAFLSKSSSLHQPNLYADSDDDTFHDAPEEPEFETETNDGDDFDVTVIPHSSESGLATLEDTDSSSHCSSQRVPSSGIASMSTEDSFPNPFTQPQKSLVRRRTAIPTRPQCSVNLWSIMRNCIGKELTKIPMPVNFNEPLSVLQRITEDLEYADLLDRAAACRDSAEQMCYVAAYAISCYSTTGNRTTKPFNPLLGETYECDRTSDRGWWSITEQVSHHPPATAHHAEGRQWIMFQDFNMTSRFRGKYLSVTPTGFTHIKFKNSNNHYAYRKITTTVHNIIVGKLWIDNHGEMSIENHFTGEKGLVKFHAYSYFSPDKARKVSGVIKDKAGQPKYVVQGQWDKQIEMAKVTHHDKANLETSNFHRIWTINPPYPNSETMHKFTQLAIELNEEEPGVAPTDSRCRPDQRLMEVGQWDESNEEKERLEERQRAKRRAREQEAENAMREGSAYPEYEPVWFEKTQDEYTGSVIHVFKGDYWRCKELQDWSKSPTLF